ncbi:MAG: aspartate carbamoyltransferase catalytic subunit [Chloroflexota bacterium]|nr:aspartate carbamoyltransferase catalytic subunit [Chloroflexota bacterium]
MTVAARLDRHLLDVDALRRDDIEHILETAAEMKAARQARRSLGHLRAETVGLLFYEPSTRTRVSFELAARALGAEVVDLAVGSSSVVKGESLVDTLVTLERLAISVLVIRHQAAGVPYLAARVTRCRIVNAGDGAHAHPTQALLDAFTLRERLGALDGRKIAIVGDLVHSRVARSNLHALTKLGASVWLTGPATLTRGFERWPGATLVPTLEDALRDADAVMALRIQRERQDGGALPSLGEYTRRWGLTLDRMRLARPGALVLHPGPMQEGIEIAADLAASERSVIRDQVANGVAVRMAVFALLSA